MKGDKRYTATDVLDDINVKNIISSDEGYKILRSLRSSPAFFQQKQKELFARESAISTSKQMVAFVTGIGCSGSFWPLKRIEKDFSFAYLSKKRLSG
jgi:hypothetical protein